MRDDTNSLPIPAAAKAYNRGHGLTAMKKQPQSYINAVAAVTNQKSKKHGFQNTDEVGIVPKSIKEAAKIVVASLLESDEDSGYHEWNVFQTEEYPYTTYGIQVPSPIVGDEQGRYVNYAKVPADATDEEKIDVIENNMRRLAAARNYPDGSFFVTPWGEYMIHAGTIGRI